MDATILWQTTWVPPFCFCYKTSGIRLQRCQRYSTGSPYPNLGVHSFSNLGTFLAVGSSLDVPAGDVASPIAFTLLAASISDKDDLDLEDTIVVTYYSALRDKIEAFLTFLRLKVKVLTVKQAKGCEAKYVIGIMFRRHAQEDQCHGTLGDPGRAAIILSRASSNLTLFLDAPIAQTSPLQHLSNCPWRGVGNDGCADCFPAGVADMMLQGFYAFRRCSSSGNGESEADSEAEAVLSRVQFWQDALSQSLQARQVRRRHPQPLELRPCA